MLELPPLTDREILAARGPYAAPDASRPYAWFVECEPGEKGDTASNVTKPATLETGLEIQVPAYLETDELVQVDTREARFISRAKG